MNKYVVVVDDDIDVTDMQDVLWAMCTRSDPERSIEILHRCRSGPLDPPIPLVQKGHNSRAVIDCCRPFEWKEQFPEVVETSRELMERVTSTWGGLLEIG
jgi:4-hydroxy-3-polyprenylbenzoate decarboxylase